MDRMYYEDFQVGQKFATSTRKVTGGDIETFLQLTGVKNPLFTDEEFAKKSIHKGRITPGPLTFALASGLGTRLGIFEGTVMAFLGMDRVRYSVPVRPEDTIKVAIEIIEKKATKKADRGIIRARWTVTNQRDEVVLSYEMAYLMERRT